MIVLYAVLDERPVQVTRPGAPGRAVQGPDVPGSPVVTHARHGVPRRCGRV